jgi:hypothetical protein
MYFCECDVCGTYRYSELLLKSQHFLAVRHLVSAWIRRQNDAGLMYPFVPNGANDHASAGKWFDNLIYEGFPNTVSEKLDALLKTYGSLVKEEIGRRIEPNKYPHLIAQIAARNYNELSALSMMLHDMKYVDFSAGSNLYIKVDGWKRVDELTKYSNTNDSVFVAMWYDSCTREYRSATTSAISYCGYKPLILDESDFNGFIMDQVISIIRRCRFIIADFTCLPETAEAGKIKAGVRGGVYWEAGMAFGLGKHVVHTCRDDDESKRRLHFDVAQYRTIFWKPDELTTTIRDLTVPISTPFFAEKLAMQILGTIGRGSNNSIDKT